MSECIVPSWKLNQQRQEVAAGEETKAIRTAHNHPPPPPAAAYVVPMSNYEVATELTWENGQVAMHGLTGILPFPFPSQPTANKVPTFVRTGDTLESIVHQATHYKSNTPNQLHHHHHHHQQDDVIVNGKETDGNKGISKKKRPRTTSESDNHEYMKMKFHGNIINSNSSSSTKNIVHEDQVVANNSRTGGGGGGAERERRACASASATFCRDAAAAATTMMTWNSFESPPRSFKTKTTDEDSACHDGTSENRDEEDVETTKDETYRSHSARRSRAAIVHNQSERRRRDRINQKMKALQKLVPNASKTDKASMLDEVIEYLKQLQTQVHMLSTTTRTIPQIMINPLAIQQQQQQQQQQISSILARMGMGVGLGMGMGMLDMNTLAAAAAARSAPFFQQQQHHHGFVPTAPTFLPPHFVVPAVHASQPNKSPADAAAAAAAAGVPFSDPYSVYLAQVCQQKLSALNIKQTMNMEFYNKMAALYRQQATNQATQTTSNSSHPNFIQRE